MEALQQVFNNREIAIGIWSIITILVLLFTKPARQFLRTAMPMNIAPRLNTQAVSS